MERYFLVKVLAMQLIIVPLENGSLAVFGFHINIWIGIH